MLVLFFHTLYLFGYNMCHTHTILWGPLCVYVVSRTISHSDVFYCHPHLLRSLGVHLTVLGLMRSYLGISVAGLEDDSFLTTRRKMKMAMSKVHRFI